MKKTRMALFALIFSFLFTPLINATNDKQAIPRTPVPVKITGSNQAWVETISICNNSTNAIPLNDIELDFSYAVTMPNNIWGQPWANWRVASQEGVKVVLLGGAPWVMIPDPNCENPITVQFNASANAPAPSGPFVFQAALNSPPPANNGNLTIVMPPAPATGLNNPQVTVQGMGQNSQKIVTWGASWQLLNITAGSYTVSSSPVTNGTQTFQANPVNVTVISQQTTQVSLNYVESRSVISFGNGTWAYDAIFDSNGNRTGIQPGLFAANINQYNAIAGTGHRITQVFSYGGDMEMYCKGSGGSPASTPCTATTMQVYYNAQSTAAYYNAANGTANPVIMYPIVDGVVGGPYLTVFNNLSVTEANLYADNVAELYCADDNVAGVSFDLEPFDINQSGQAAFYTQIAKNFAGQHNGPGQPDPYNCVNAKHPNGRSFSVFTGAFRVNAKLAAILNQYGNGFVIDSLYDLGSNPGGVANSITSYINFVNGEVAAMMSTAKTNNVKYQFGIPSAASVHEFESMNGQNTGFNQIDYVKAAINAINSHNARQDKLFIGIDLWGWSQRMIWNGKEFTPSTPNTTVQSYLATQL